jgi:hypothetical protein
LTFEISGLAETADVPHGNASEGWFLKSVTHEGVDITDAGYDFRPGQRVSGIEIRSDAARDESVGNSAGGSGNPVGDYTVVAFSTKLRQWGHQTGSFAARGRTRGASSRFVLCPR